MKTLKLTLVFASLMLTPFLGTAQESSKKHNKEHHEKLIKELQLNEKQTEQLTEIRKKTQQENKAIKAKMAPLKAEMKKLKAEKKALHDSKMKEIETILTPEQFAKFKELKAENKLQRKNKKRQH